MHELLSCVYAAASATENLAIWNVLPLSKQLGNELGGRKSAEDKKGWKCGQRLTAFAAGRDQMISSRKLVCGSAKAAVYFRSHSGEITELGGSSSDMTWIRTVSLPEADEKLRKAIEGEKAFYPKEYADPVHPDPSGASSIVGSHTLIPEALYHAFSTFGALMSPELPLNRTQHEMIATMVSVTNRCVY